MHIKLVHKSQINHTDHLSSAMAHCKWLLSLHFIHTQGYVNTSIVECFSKEIDQFWQNLVVR